jgi:hypothetical protein
MQTPLPPLDLDTVTIAPGAASAPLGVLDMAALGGDARDAEIRDLVSRWIAAEWTWTMEPAARLRSGTLSVTVEMESAFDVRIRNRFVFRAGSLDHQEIVCEDLERGVYLVVSAPSPANREADFDHAALHRLADAMIGMGIVQPLGAEEKLAGDRLSEVRS